jgi:hypothetical protein
LAVLVVMSVAAVTACFGISRSRPATPPVSEERARAEANEIVKDLARLDGYPFDARYSEGARDQAIRLAELTKDATCSITKANVRSSGSGRSG